MRLNFQNRPGNEAIMLWVVNAFIVAVQGLVVPVLRNVETMNYADIEIGIQDLGTKV